MAATESLKSFPTVGSIAEQFRVPIHQVLHIIRSRGIKAIGRAGMANVYSEADVQRIGDELRQIAERRTPQAADSHAPTA